MSEPANTPVLTAGWSWPGNATKCHYFPENDLTSLCGKWGFFGGQRSRDVGRSRDDCAGCRKKLDALAQSAEQSTSIAKEGE